MSRTLSILALIACLALVPVIPAAAQQPLDFDLPTVDGGRLKLSDFRGRVVILDFFATWCRPCKSALTKMDSLAKEQRSRGVSVIGFALDEAGVQKVRPFVTKLELDFPVVLGDMPLARKLTASHGGLQVVPTSLIIDPQGYPVKRFQGLVSKSEVMAAVRPHLNGKPAPTPATAIVDRFKPGERRFQRVWMSDQQVLGGKTGFFIHVMAEVADLAAEQGLWLALHLQPEARSGSGLAPLDKPKVLFQRIEDASKKHYILFVTCDQLPAAPQQGVYRTWVSLLGPDQSTLEKSGEFVFQKPTCLTAQVR